MVDLNKSDSVRVKFAHVEILRTGAGRQAEPLEGLFLGLKTRTDVVKNKNVASKFIMLGNKEKKNDLRTLNLDSYNILSLTMKYAGTKELIVFKADDIDQTKAIETLAGLVEELRKDKRMARSDPELVDIETYNEVPGDLAKSTGAKTTLVGDNYDYTGANTGFGRCGYNNENWKVKQEARKKEEERQDKLRWTPTTIKREGEKPALKMLNLMKKKISQIASGDYEYELPDPEAACATEITDDSGKATCDGCMHADVAGEPGNAKECKECDDLDNYEVALEDDDNVQGATAEGPGEFIGE